MLLRRIWIILLDLWNVTKGVLSGGAGTKGDTPGVRDAGTVTLGTLPPWANVLQ